MCALAYADDLLLLAEEDEGRDKVHGGEVGEVFR